MFRPLTVLVTGATGKQGGALARLLLKRGHRVHAFVRSPGSPQAKDLEERGAELVSGDFDDPDSLERAMQGVDAVYAMATPFAAGGLEAEVRHGRHLIDTAKITHVRHFVYSSVAGADQNTGIPHFETKFVVEEHLRRSSLPYTIVAPVFFMENFVGPTFTERLREGVLAMPLPRHRGLQMIPTADIAAFCTRVLEWPDELFGRRIEIASDEVTGEQAAALISYVSGHKARYEEIPLEALRSQSEDAARMFEWFQREGYHADIAGLRRDYPEVGWHTFEDWARLQDWDTLLGPPWRGPTAAEPSLT
ncbi:NmrA/HSCARG family protein [Vitiosangium sp. GDMCC 1.1324]|uniref:NmrA/HSCARG family protein n=1 Tax=Vitiosangium sp. (strain GDMCC 1.1324) TaxID=2138576 RepID=UPI000D350D1B|nr:NmrA/HSCARG family protein [Vitiosangium sp. GDMCC 1.1324]PTL83288.1 NmrA/HSCARG family protein [Vitiosangium sp. GDMCC 1.1324]